jgi:hypothetical protein
MSNTKTCPKCRTEIDARATICPACRSKQPAFSRPLSLLLFFGFIAIVATWMTGEKKTTPPPATPTAPPNAQRQSDAAATAPVRSMPDDFFNYEKRAAGSAVRGLYDITPSKHDWTIADLERWNRENPEQLKAFRDRRWRAEFATLVLFERNCAPGRFDSVRAKMFAKWNALPAAERTEAVNYEIEQINRRKDFVLPTTGEVFPGGFKWFCKIMSDRLADGSYRDMIYPDGG